MASISESMDQIIYVGIGLFVLVLILALVYQSYATSVNSFYTTYCVAGSGAYCYKSTNDLSYGGYTNLTKYGGPLPNVFAGALQLAIFALVFIAVILAVVGALRGGGGIGAGSGGFLAK